MKAFHGSYLFTRLGIALLLTVILAASASAQNKEKSVTQTPYQVRVIVTPLGTGFQSSFLELPAGKRFVIENVSVITRSPEGMRMEVNFFSYIDRNGDGVGDVADITFNRVTLIDQGVFDGVSLATANHKVLVFADAEIGAGRYGLTAQARLNAMPPANSFTQAQFTFSGYLEDLPAVP